VFIIMELGYYKEGDTIDTSALLLLSPPLAKAAAVFLHGGGIF
jgi:hypothetical protein